MSLHYERTLSLRLRPDSPGGFLDELRFYLGLTDQAPRSPTLDLAHAELTTGDEDVLAGGPIVRLVPQQEPGIGPPGWGLFVRTFVLDDAMYDLIQVVPSWLARWSLTEGWIGFAREELNLNIWLSFYCVPGSQGASCCSTPSR